jgi:cyclohexanecarboxylate-CoA ligase
MLDPEALAPVYPHLFEREWPERLVTDFLRKHARSKPDKPALVDESRGRSVVLGFAELADRVDRIATSLLKMGVRPGEVVCFQLPNYWEFVALQFALVRVGAVSCPLIPVFRERELKLMVGQSESRFLFIPDTFRGFDYPSMVEGLRPSLPALERVFVVGDEVPGWTEPFESLLETAPDPETLEAARPAPSEPTQLLYTSGTSGEPKGVLHVHNTLVLADLLHIEHFGLREDDTVFVPSPCAHQTGFLYGMWLAMVRGATAVYQDIWEGRRALDLVTRHGVRFVQAATPFLVDLVEAVKERGVTPEALRIFVATGASVPRRLAQEAREVLGASVCGAWGTTEGCLVTAGTPEDPPEKSWQTDGRLLPRMEMRVVDEKGNPLPAGREGRFQVRTPCLFTTYLHHPEWYRTAVSPDGWFDTGDLAVIDGDGYMSITGRVKDIINRGGEKVPVAEVEQLLYEHPAVSDVAVVAMPDPRLGERACAYVVLRKGASLSLHKVQEYLRTCGMAKQYWPERVEAVEELPRTPSGKIQKYLLRKRAAGLA